MTDSVCECGTAVTTYPNSGLCNRCYKREWWRAKKSPGPRESAKSSTKPISYAHAHNRLRRYRGPARNFECANSCGRQAAEWSYRGGSEFEQRELVTVRANGIERTFLSSWSVDINSYDPLCRPCHLERDAK